MILAGPPKYNSEDMRLQLTVLKEMVLKEAWLNSRDTTCIGALHSQEFATFKWRVNQAPSYKQKISYRGYYTLRILSFVCTIFVNLLFYHKIW